MAFDAEYREFFLRIIKVTSGTKPDQEVGYAIEELIKGKKRNNRFLVDNFPTEGIYKKLFNSLPFKLNKEDTATASVQGLVKKASDANVETRTSNASTDYVAVPLPHQLPEVVVATDGNDAVISTVTANGITLSILRRTLAGLYRRNYKIDILVQDSITFDNSTKKIKLVADNATPGNNMLYGTDPSGNKGWYSILDVSKGIMLTSIFNVGNASTVAAVVGGGGNELRIRLNSLVTYKFDAILHVNTIDNANGVKIGVYAFGGLTVSQIKWQAEYIEDGNTTFVHKATVAALNSDSGITGPGVGMYRITGSVTVTNIGDLEIRAALNTAGAGPTNLVLGVGSYLTGLKLSVTKPTI